MDKVPYPAKAVATIANARILLLARIWMLVIRLLCICFAPCFDFDTHRNDFAVSGYAVDDLYRTGASAELNEFNACIRLNARLIDSKPVVERP